MPPIHERVKIGGWGDSLGIVRVRVWLEQKRQLSFSVGWNTIPLPPVPGPSPPTKESRKKDGAITTRI